MAKKVLMIVNQVLNPFLNLRGSISVDRQTRRSSNSATADQVYLLVKISRSKTVTNSKVPAQSVSEEVLQRTISRSLLPYMTKMWHR